MTKELSSQTETPIHPNASTETPTAQSASAETSTHPSESIETAAPSGIEQTPTPSAEPSGIEQTPTPSAEPSGVSAPTAKKGGRWLSVGIVGLATMLSRVAGLARDMIFAALFDRRATDAFFLAFTLPNLLRRLLAEGILSTAFVPVFSGYQEKSEQEQRKAYSAVFTLFVLVLACVTVLCVWAAPWLVKLFAPGFVGEKLQLTIYLTRIVFPFLFLAGVSAFWFGLLHTRGHFAAPALGPVMLNLGMIACALSARWIFPESIAVTAMAVGVLVGGILQWMLQVVAWWRLGIRFGWSWQPKHPAIQEILLLMGPTLIGLGIYQLNLLVSRAFASFLPEGAMTYLYYSDRLTELPLGVIAVAFATVNLPALAARAEKSDWDGFRDVFGFGIRGVIFVCLPAAVGLFVLRKPIVSLLFERGHFTHYDVAECAHIFAPAACGLLFVAMLRNITPGFYALKDTRTPVKIAFLSFVLNAALSWVFAFGFRWEAFGLTLANAATALISVVLSLVALRRRLGELPMLGFWKLAGQVSLASAGMALVLSVGLWWEPYRSLGMVTRLVWMTGVIGLGGGLFLCLAVLFRIPELQRATEKIRRRLQRKKS